MPIEYKETAVLPEPAVRELYADSNWSVYTRDMPRLMAAIGNSLKSYPLGMGKSWWAWCGRWETARPFSTSRISWSSRSIGDGASALHC